MIHYLAARIACLVCGHKQPARMQMQQLDDKTMKPTGRGIWICERCGTICWTT